MIQCGHRIQDNQGRAVNTGADDSPGICINRGEYNQDYGTGDRKQAAGTV